MPISEEQVKPGVKVRVIKNRVNAHKVDRDTLSPEFLQPGDVVELNGKFTTFHQNRDGCRYIAVTSTGESNFILREDVELVDELEASLTPKIRGPHLCKCPPLNFAYNGVGCQCGGL